MKVKFYCDSGANIHSCREEVVDSVEDWGMTPEECAELTEDDKLELALDWANDRLDIGMEILD
ncbi:hypothetical protein VPBG_00184 [Vibrio phage helene 12B3]|uniref:hypothetical protein n=1 Tax=Vibrio phage helene 12B3 TaxID=573173 RepID=UPI0002C0609E|nr:hypothetical protein VPBG_00184 [Vibrio phage helene 12B3]YP_009223053.1 hypothetical protein VPLG_00204 [Vibrio phage eugene 12A10]AGG57956.1 hypothetical protein VPBG_00184 [Vibrio phage helene 12B3]AGN51643.1 hypothetical protein VPLG_00204 [Vibrio phage eugene 12A10]